MTIMPVSKEDREGLKTWIKESDVSKLSEMDKWFQYNLICARNGGLVAKIHNWKLRMKYKIDFDKLKKEVEEHEKHRNSYSMA